MNIERQHETTAKQQIYAKANNSNSATNIAMPTKDVNDFRYHRLERDPQYTDLQFVKSDVKIPVKAILIAVFMFVTGTIMIVIGALLFTGHIDSKFSDRMWPLFIMGALLFLPGFYHVRIAYCAWRKYDGYSFEDIPADED